MRHQIIAKKTNWFQSPWVAIILLAGVAWGCFSVVRAYGKDHEAVTLRDQSAHELVDLKSKQTVITGQIHDLSTSRGIEAEIRNRYRVQRPGEDLVIIVDNQDPVAPVPPPTIWDKIRSYIGW